MAELHPDFCLDLHSKPQTVIWKKNTVARLTPIADNQKAKGDYAFIVGSGPSLKECDISPIGNNVTFGVNGSIKKFTNDRVTPDYYVICDANFVRERWDVVKDVIALKPHCFFTPSVLNEICIADPSLLEGLTISVFDDHFKVYNKPIMSYPEIIQLATHDPDIITHNGKIGFSRNPGKGLFSAHTVIYYALQIAYGLGYRHIGILGMDLNFDEGETRFYETGNKAAPSYIARDYFDRILPSFMVVKYLCEQTPLSIYNLSLSSKLPSDVIPKIELSELLKNRGDQ